MISTQAAAAEAAAKAEAEAAARAADAARAAAAARRRAAAPVNAAVVSATKVQLAATPLRPFRQSRRPDDESAALVDRTG